MMRRWTIIMMSMGMLLSMACNRIEDVSTVEDTLEGVELTVKATFADGVATKTVLTPDRSIFWTKGDAINLFYGSRSSGKFISSIQGDPKPTSDFVGTLTVATGSSEAGMSAKAFLGIYPYNESNECDGAGVTMTLPDRQESVAGSFADKLNPSVATSSGLDLSFYNVGAPFYFSVTQEGVTSVSFRGNNEEDIAGKIHVTMDADGHPAVEVLEGVKSITLSAPTSGYFEPGVTYVMVLLPTEMLSGYTVSFKKGDLEAECVVSKSVSFERSRGREKKNADEGLEYVPDSNNISFADSGVKEVCVEKWDSDGDGELSYEEAAVVQSITWEVFNGVNITSFDEFQYFTGVTTIGEEAFCNQSELVSITLPNNVTTIGGYAFCNCYKLEGINIPNNVTTIGSGAFANCYKLSEVTLPYGVQSIEETLFFNSYGLECVTLPEGVLTIGDSAFLGCSNLKSVNIPSTVTSIGSSAFLRCSDLSSITIPDGVITIGSEAFAECSSLSSITIPESVQTMYYPFRGCTGLKSLFFYPKTSPFSSSSVNLDNTNNCPIFVPSSGINSYKSTFSNDSNRVIAMSGGVNLGLSVDWASCNYGAGLPNEYGTYYTWATAQGLDFGASRLPTKDEMSELLLMCSSIKTADGYILYRNNNSIFLPLSGGFVEGSYYSHLAGGCSIYLTSSKDSADNWYRLYINGDSAPIVDNTSSGGAWSIRLVQDKY